MTIRLPLLLLFALTAFPFRSATAQLKPDKDLSAVLASAVAAVGGQTDISNIKSIDADADCVGPKGTYTTSISSFRDDKTRFEQRFSYRAPSSTFINGNVAWERLSDVNEYSLASPFQRMAARAHEYQKMAFDIRSFFSELELAGDEIFEGRPNTKIHAKNELGMATNLYFDKETGRLNGYILLIPNSTETVKNVFLEWKKIGKVTLPSVVRATDSQGEWTLRFHTIRLNIADDRVLNVPPRVADQAELMRLHEQQKTAHLTYNAELFVEMFADNVTQLQRGTMSSKTKAENLARFKSYFSSFKFSEWEDIAPPVIKISKDGTMATKTVRKRVRGSYKNEKGEDVSDHTVFAWLEVWEKLDGRWKLTTIASTERTVAN
ncbi:MAG: nuclear transport factor 2 family protein [Pyrinomonadaceae bacterium]|nr:nuclear transport factor 2 family protein [Chloracidobacterium sp.]MBP7416431.1 nuclear transport factor 2 family protein [Pyrinomonadaceae bacterium]